MAPAALTGSWAGAMGQSQFMPSSFRQFAVDHDGDGKADIWNDQADVFASIAHYLSALGWNARQGWGLEVRLPPRFDKRLADGKVEKPVAAWQKLGVKAAGGGALPDPTAKAYVVLPAGAAGPAYLAYPNYKVILRWNRSDFFAIAAGQLADRIGAN
jgi:membrane-bound lytic murein transglycosylase B